MCLLITFLFITSSFSFVSTQCLNDQRSLLLRLNSSLIYKPSLSTKLVQWNQNIDCCNWHGVECDRFGHVISLELDNEAITGGIENSSPLFSFRYLEKLSLSYNNFNDTHIQRGLGKLTNLARLNLSNAGFGGKVPVELSQLTNLVVLDLSSEFSSTLKLEDPNLKNFVQNLTSLEELYLDYVNISSQSDWWEALSLALPNLRNLSLRDCSLSGPLNPSYLQLQALSVLHLDSNNLSTTGLNIFANFRNLTMLSLGFCSLQGAFPENIFQVTTLQYLDLSNNMFLTGTIPEFPSGSAFTTLILLGSNFSGSVPDSIINLRMLTNIYLNDCNFNGPLPPTIGNLPELVRLELSSNFFTGSVPVFSNSRKLKDINLSHNRLNGSISSKHFEGLNNLSYLGLSFNSLTGNIPTSLFRLPSLHLLELSDNKFSGQVNEFSAPNSSLEVLDLSSNQLEGPVPRSFFELGNLNVLKLSFNYFDGAIQLESFQNLEKLTRLELAYNHFSSVHISSGSSELSSFPQLSWLNLASCNMSTFPNLRNQTNLEFLDLSNNNISGYIPSWIWEIGDGSLIHLNLSHNFFVNMQTPYKFSDSLELLDLHSNMLCGELPVDPASLKYMDYSNNNFQGPILVNIVSNVSSNYPLFFSVANNSLSGEIPITLCNGFYLEVLDLSGNLLSGELPHCLVQNRTNLAVLNIGRNNISGSIPDSFPVNCGLSTLDMSRNNLQGKIPATLANCKSLQVLNVGSNNINDRFPCMLQNSSRLHVLVLRSNKYFGNISCPRFNQEWPNLQIIDIASNNFSGSLYPRLISSLTGMKLNNTPRLRPNPLSYSSPGWIYYQDKVIVTLKGLELELSKILTVYTSIDLSSNKFQGVIPDTIGELSSIYALNLSHNSFTGTIPRSIVNLTVLESLDVSLNQLTGVIPVDITSLTFLSFFNVSYNKLFGRIPSGFQFLTFSASSYEGNIGLCGPPLNTGCDSHEPTETSAIGSGEKAINWLFILAGAGYATGVALVVLPPLFSRRWGERFDELQVKLLKLICM